jgi:plasmid maintenance system antidote protein VapI
MGCLTPKSRTSTACDGKPITLLSRSSVKCDTALRLAHFFDTSAQFWLNLQSLYDLRLAQEKVGRSIKALPMLKRRDLVHA